MCCLGHDADSATAVLIAALGRLTFAMPMNDVITHRLHYIIRQREGERDDYYSYDEQGNCHWTPRESLNKSSNSGIMY